MRRFDLLEEAARRAGGRKILFGSDGPWLHPGLELAKVRALRLDRAAERRVLGGNFLDLIARVRQRARQAPPAPSPPRDIPAEPDPWVSPNAV